MADARKLAALQLHIGRYLVALVQGSGLEPRLRAEEEPHCSQLGPCQGLESVAQAQALLVHMRLFGFVLCFWGRGALALDMAVAAYHG